MMKTKTIFIGKLMLVILIIVLIFSILKIEIIENLIIDKQLLTNEFNFNEYVFNNNLDKGYIDIEKNLFNRNITAFFQTDDVSNKNAVVYIYNTYQLDSYYSHIISDYDVRPNVMMSSFILKEYLSKYDISSIVETSNIELYASENNIDYLNYYEASRYFLDIQRKNNHNLKYLIDIHRSYQTKENTTIEKDNKKIAKIGFIIGKDNENYEANYENVKKLESILTNENDSILMKTQIKQGPYIDGVCNQDVSDNMFSVVIGGVENTIDEVNESIKILSKALSIYIRKDNE